MNFKTLNAKNNPFRNFLLAITVIAGICIFGDQAFAQTDIGLVGVKSIHGRYLQAHDDNGEMHASNEHRNTEETWHLIEIDRARHIYALLNWRNHKFMSKGGNGCAPASRTTLSQSEQWIMVSGKDYGVLNAVAFKSVVDGTFLGANPAGENDRCGGEVASRDAASPPRNNGGWPGWWVLESAGAPEAGKDFWNGAGRFFQGIATQIKPADIAALIPLLAM